jgi:hypothetical protein
MKVPAGRVTVTGPSDGFLKYCAFAALIAALMAAESFDVLSGVAP